MSITTFKSKARYATEGDETPADEITVEGRPINADRPYRKAAGLSNGYVAITVDYYDERPEGTEYKEDTVLIFHHVDDLDDFLANLHAAGQKAFAADIAARREAEMSAIDAELQVAADALRNFFKEFKF